MSEYNYYEQLKQGLEDAIAYKKGDKKRARSSIREIAIPEYNAADITRLRTALCLSQRGLAYALDAKIDILGFLRLGYEPFHVTGDEGILDELDAYVFGNPCFMAADGKA